MKKLQSILILSLIIMISTVFSSCKKEEEVTPKTQAKITLLNANNPESGWVIYAFKSSNWDIGHRQKIFAVEQSTTESGGVATFSDLDEHVMSGQETLYFVVYYSRGGDNYYKSVPLTFEKGEVKSATLSI